MNAKRWSLILVVGLVLGTGWGLAGCSAPPSEVSPNLAAADAAEAFFRGVYTCDSAAIREHGAEDVALSYPIFQEIFGAPTIHGLENVVAFSQRFCSRWLEPEATIHDRIADAGRVVLVWGFEAEAAEGSGQRQSWGGISYFLVNDEGLVTAELGEESAPGPFGRWDPR